MGRESEGGLGMEEVFLTSRVGSGAWRLVEGSE